MAEIDPGPSVREAILAAVPSLRAFAIKLSGDVDRADDLVQETLLRAMANAGSFQPGTSMLAWLFTILRNLFRSEYRKHRHEVPVDDFAPFEAQLGAYAKSHPEPRDLVAFEEYRAGPPLGDRKRWRARSLRLSREDRRMLEEIHDAYDVNWTAAIRCGILAAHANLRRGLAPELPRSRRGDSELFRQWLSQAEDERLEEIMAAYGLTPTVAIRVCIGTAHATLRPQNKFGERAL